MNHYVLTRSSYDPKVWPIDANRRRLEITRAVTVPLMAAQERGWTWLVLVHPSDPIRDERLDAFRAAGHPVTPIVWKAPFDPQSAAWDRRKANVRVVEKHAATAYRAPWRQYMEIDSRLLQTRLDDDDGLAPDGIARYRTAATAVRRRQILMLPNGVRVYRGRWNDVIHERNAMHTLVTFPSDKLCVYDYGHTVCQRTAPVQIVDREWGWMWTRHADTISGWKTDHPLLIDDRLRAAFPIDWQRLEQAWR